jgi:hypothetical protein
MKKSTSKRLHLSTRWVSPAKLRGVAVGVATLVLCGEQACSSDMDAVGHASKASDDPLNNPCEFGDCTVVGSRVAPVPGPVCPRGEPNAGDQCGDAATCTYGNSVSSHCRREYQCTNDIWVAQESRPFGCASHPESYCSSEPQPGGVCTTDEFERFFIPCEFPGGVRCHCVGNPVTRAGIQGQWECFGPPRNGACPELLPNLGDGCLENGQYCNYGIVEESCYSPYAGVYCSQGVWEKTDEGCAL